MRYVVLEDFNSKNGEVLAGSIVDDASADLAPLFRAGMAAAPILYNEDLEVISEFNSARGNRTHTGDDFGDLFKLWMGNAKSAASYIKTASGASVQTVLSAGGALSSTTPTANVPDQAGAVGVGTTVARADHAHATPCAAPVSLGATNSEGVSTSLARADHVHLSPLIQSGYASVTDDTTTVSTTYVDLLTVNMTTGANKLTIFANASASNDSLTPVQIAFLVLLDDVAMTGFAVNGLTTDAVQAGGCVFQITTTAAAHVIKVQWLVSSGTGQIRPDTAPIESASLFVQESSV